MTLKMTERGRRKLEAQLERLDGELSEVLLEKAEAARGWWKPVARQFKLRGRGAAGEVPAKPHRQSA